MSKSAIMEIALFSAYFLRDGQVFKKMQGEDPYATTTPLKVTKKGNVEMKGDDGEISGVSLASLLGEANKPKSQEPADVRNGAIKEVLDEKQLADAAENKKIADAEYARLFAERAILVNKRQEAEDRFPTWTEKDTELQKAAWYDEKEDCIQDATMEILKWQRAHRDFVLRKEDIGKRQIKGIPTTSRIKKEPKVLTEEEQAKVVEYEQQLATAKAERDALKGQMTALTDGIAEQDAIIKITLTELKKYKVIDDKTPGNHSQVSNYEMAQYSRKRISEMLTAEPDRKIQDIYRAVLKEVFEKYNIAPANIGAIKYYHKYLQFKLRKTPKNCDMTDPQNQLLYTEWTPRVNEFYPESYTVTTYKKDGTPVVTHIKEGGAFFDEEEISETNDRYKLGWYAGTYKPKDDIAAINLLGGDVEDGELNDDDETEQIAKEESDDDLEFPE